LGIFDDWLAYVKAYYFTKINLNKTRALVVGRRADEAGRPDE
jgi:hypothetical protein